MMILQFSVDCAWSIITGKLTGNYLKDTVAVSVHIAAWHLLGHAESVTGATFPQWEEKYLVEDSFEYPVSFNGKVRFKLNMPLTATQAEIEAAVKASPEAGKWLEGKEIRKMIIVPKKIVNVVIA